MKKIKGIIEEVTDIKCAQSGISRDLEKIRADNQALYRDMSYIIEKSVQQQMILEKVIHH